MTHAMQKGSNIQLESAAVRAVLRWTPGVSVPDIDASALLLGRDDRVRSDQDFVFYNQPRHPSGLVRKLSKQRLAEGTLTDTVEAELTGLPQPVERILIAASADGGTFGDVPDLALLLRDAGSGEDLAYFEVEPDTGEETALICGELYRRADTWKFRALGQGYATGLIGLATECGVLVDDEPEQGGQAPSAGAPGAEPERPAAPVPSPAAPVPPPSAPRPVPVGPAPEPVHATVPDPPHPRPLPIPDPVPSPGPEPGPRPEPSPVPPPKPEPDPGPEPSPIPRPPGPEPAAASYGYPHQPFPPAPPAGSLPAAAAPATLEAPRYGYPHQPAPPPPMPAVAPGPGPAPGHGPGQGQYGQPQNGPGQPQAQVPAQGRTYAQPDPAFALPPQGPQFIGQ